MIKLLYFLIYIFIPIFSIASQSKNLLQEVWEIPKDERLFSKNVQIKFVVEDNKLVAKVNTENKISTDAIIWNLKYKNGEYIYGWLGIGEKKYRCKLWEAMDKLYLRVYFYPIYKSYTLKKVYGSKTLKTGYKTI